MLSTRFFGSGIAAAVLVLCALPVAAQSFKVQCPSCEAQVPVRDPALIGKKIDCPKCKYRFVVEEPSDDILGDAEEAPRKGSRAPLEMYPGLILTDASGQPTKAVEAVLRDGAALDFSRD